MDKYLKWLHRWVALKRLSSIIVKFPSFGIMRRKGIAIGGRDPLPVFAAANKEHGLIGFHG
jgi:hypothetical protein